MKKAVMTFGRFNPPTKGHVKLVDRVKNQALSESAQPIVLLSHSEDNNNPLSYENKFGFVRSAFGPVVRNSDAKNLLEALVAINEMGYDSVTCVAGSDRINEYERILRSRNGKEFYFEEWEVISAGERDPDASDDSGISASRVRDLAAGGDLQEFVTMVPDTLTMKEKERLYSDLREGMDLEEEIEITDEDFEFTDEELDAFIDMFEDEIFLEEDEWEEELDPIEERVLSVAQRRKAGRALRRKSKKMNRRRKIRRKRKADPARLKTRARRAARQAVRKRVAGKTGARYSKLSPSQKVAIDRRLVKKAKQIDRISKRMLPKVRRKERIRLQKARSKKEGYEETMSKRTSINESFDSFIAEMENKERKLKRALREKARKSGIPVSIIREVYDRGVEDYSEHDFETVTESQWAFRRVNSFIDGGKARTIDEDLWADVDRTNMVLEKIGLKEE